MNKERKLLKRALKYVGESSSDVAEDLYDEICDYLDEPLVAESASTELVDELVVALEYCIKKIPVFAYVPGIIVALEKARGEG